mgnify:CR=1 FL=1
MPQMFFLQDIDLLKQFKTDYYDLGKYDLGAQVPHMARLADYYEQRYKATDCWTDCLKVEQI